MNKYNSESYKDQFKPAKRAVEGDRAMVFTGELSIYQSQSCLVGVDSPMGGSMVYLFDVFRTEISSIKTRVLSIEPTPTITMEEKFQKEIDDLETGKLGNAFKQLFKKK